MLKSYNKIYTKFFKGKTQLETKVDTMLLKHPPINLCNQNESCDHYVIEIRKLKALKKYLKLITKDRERLDKFVYES